TAHARVTGGDVIATFNACVAESGRPASTLTDNALVYTARFRGGRNTFEYHLAQLGITQNNGSPSHPQSSPVAFGLSLLLQVRRPVGGHAAMLVTSSSLALGAASSSLLMSR